MSNNPTIWKAVGYLLLFLLLGAILAGCDSGSSGGGVARGGAGGDGGDYAGTPSVKYPGFNFMLTEGDFWEWGWRSKDYSYQRGDRRPQTSTSEGFLRLTLGEMVEIQGVVAFEAIYSGRLAEGRKPIWNFIAVADNKVMGSTDGEDLTTLFNGESSLQPGSGFFESFHSQDLAGAAEATLDNDFITLECLKLETIQDTSRCEYFPGHGTICGGGFDENLIVKEYYAPDVGAVGYYLYVAVGDDFGSSSRTTECGLIASSLWGDTVSYELEVEPNNSRDQAQLLIAPAVVHGDLNQDRFSSAPVITLNTATESPPNNSPSSADSIAVPTLVAGNVDDCDAGTVINLSSINPPSFYPSIEDWFSIATTQEATSSNRLEIRLDFPGSPRVDLDLYLFNHDATRLLEFSVDDNIHRTTSQWESIVLTDLPVGRYLIAVDAYDTDARAKDVYTLNVEFDNNPNQVKIVDWFEVSLRSGERISLRTENGWQGVLFDRSGAKALGMCVPVSEGGKASFLSPRLPAGTYYIGMVRNSHGGAYYVLNIELQ